MVTQNAATAGPELPDRQVTEREQKVPTRIRNQEPAEAKVNDADGNPDRDSGRGRLVGAGTAALMLVALLHATEGLRGEIGQPGVAIDGHDQVCLGEDRAQDMGDAGGAA